MAQYRVTKQLSQSAFALEVIMVISVKHFCRSVLLKFSRNKFLVKLEDVEGWHCFEFQGVLSPLALCTSCSKTRVL